LARGEIDHVFSSWLALILQTAQLGLEAQNVMALRLMRLAGGGATGLDEARLMVTDKMTALTEAQLEATATVLAGRGHKVAAKVLDVFKKRVRANRDRLSNQSPLSPKAR
jgi:hypothetical protein